MQRLVFVGFLFVAGTVWGQYQMQPNQAQPIQQAPLQTPPKSITLNGVPVQPNVQADNRTATPGYGSPYSGGAQVAQTNPLAQQGSVYGLPAQREPQSQPTYQPQPVAGQPMYVAQGNPPVAGQPMYVAQGNPPVAGQSVYAAQGNPSVAGQSVGQPAVQPATGPGPEGRQYMGRSAPESRIVPHVLNPAEQKELDEFLVRWEQYSGSVKRYEVEFTSYEYDPVLNPDNKPAYTTFGMFKYTAPNRFVYHVEGQWVDGKQVKSGPKEEKIIIDGNSIFEYSFKAKEVRQYNIAPELLSRGFADSPLPLIFGAKADEMKKRFSMKIVTRDEYKDSQVWLEAKPLLIADQQEFLNLEIRIDKKTLRATALKKDNINGKAYTVYVLNDPMINSPIDFSRLFQPTTPFGWKLIVVDDKYLQAGPKPAEELPKTANPYPPTPQPQPNPTPGNEIKLY